MPKYTGMLYQFVSDAIRIKFSELYINGVKYEDRITLEGNSLLFNEILEKENEWENIEIEFAIDITQESMKQIMGCMPTKSSPEDVNFIMTAYDKEANLRWSVDVEKVSGNYLATIQLERNKVFGAGIKLNAYALPKNSIDPPINDFASSSSERIADSNELSIWLIEKPDALGKGMNPQFKRFSAQMPEPAPSDPAEEYDGDQKELVNRNPNAFYCVEIINQEPTLFLNDHEDEDNLPFRYIRKLLEDKDAGARSHQRKRQQVVHHPVMQSIYLQLAIVALLTIFEEASDDADMYFEDYKSEWECKTLKQIAQKAGGRTWINAIKEWLEHWGDGDYLKVITEISLILQGEDVVDYSSKVLGNEKILFGVED